MNVEGELSSIVYHVQGKNRRRREDKKGREEKRMRGERKDKRGRKR